MPVWQPLHSGTYAGTAGHALADAQRSTAASAYEEALARYQVLGNPVLACEPRAGLASLAFARGDYRQALAHVEVIVGTTKNSPRVGLDEPFWYMTSAAASSTTPRIRAGRRCCAWASISSSNAPRLLPTTRYTDRS